MNFGLMPRLLVYPLVLGMLACGTQGWCQPAHPAPLKYNLASLISKDDQFSSLPPIRYTLFDRWSGRLDSPVNEALGNGQNFGDPGSNSSASQSAVVSGNPAATDLQVGSGWLGDQLGINRNGF